MREKHHRRMAIASALTWFALGGVGSACLTATQVELEIRTNVPCSDVRGVSIEAALPSALDGHPSGTVTSTCVDGVVGSIVVVPSSARDALIGIKVVLGDKLAVEDCVAPTLDPSRPATGAGCIVARRAFRFVPHRSYRLPIDLRSDCLNVVCPADATCFRGTCYPAAIDLAAEDCSAGDDCGDAMLFGEDSQPSDLLARYPLDGNFDDATGAHDLVALDPNVAVFAPSSAVFPEGNLTLGPTGQVCADSDPCINGAIGQSFADVDLANGLTLETWYFQPNGYNDSGTLLGFGNPDGTPPFLGVRLAWGNPVAHAVGGAATTQAMYARPEQGCWHHAALVVPQGGVGNIKFFLNGELDVPILDPMKPDVEPTVLNAPPTVSGMPFRLGRWWLSGASVLRMDEARVWRRPLSAAEIFQHAQPRPGGTRCGAPG